MVAEGKYLCGASLHGFPVWMNNPTLFIYLFILLFAKYCTYKMVTHCLVRTQRSAFPQSIRKPAIPLIRCVANKLQSSLREDFDDKAHVHKSHNIKTTNVQGGVV